MTKRFTFLFLCLVAVARSNAQDIHFSQFYATPVMQNPAFTGFFNGNYRFTAIARSQWRSVTPPYKTIGGSYDLSVPTGSRGSKDVWGVGMNVTTDRAGDSHLVTNRVDLTAAYNKTLDRFNKSFLSTGLQVSYTGASFDPNGLTFDENFEHGITTENFASTSVHYADASAGMQYTYLVDKDDNFTFGAAAFHINQPTLTYFGDGTSRVDRKYVLNASATYGSGRSLKWFPKVNYQKQGTNSELNFGLFARCTIPKTEDLGVYVGMLHRWKDAVIMVTRFDMNDMAFTFSYDFNYSKLAKVSQGLGGPEVSLQYVGAFKHKAHRKVFCPQF